MKLNSNQFLKACSISLALLGSTAIVATLVVPGYAYAKSSKSGGNGNSGGGHGADKSDNGKSGGKASGSGRTKTKSSGGGARKFNGKGFSLKNLFGGKKKRSTTKRSVTKPTKSLHTAKVKGELHPSQLGNMNGAINSSPNAKLAHIRNGNFQGPVGLAAALAVADYNFELDNGAFNEAKSVVDLAAAFDLLGRETLQDDVNGAQAQLDLAEALEAYEILNPDSNIEYTEYEIDEAKDIVTAYEKNYKPLEDGYVAASEEDLAAAQDLLDDVAAAEALTVDKADPDTEALAEAQAIYDDGDPQAEVDAAIEALLDAWNKGSSGDDDASLVLIEIRNSLPTDEEIANALLVEEEGGDDGDDDGEGDDASIDEAETELVPDTTSDDTEES